MCLMLYAEKYIEGIIKVEDYCYFPKNVFSAEFLPVYQIYEYQHILTSDLQNKQILTCVDQQDAEFDRTCKSGLMLSSFVYI